MNPGPDIQVEVACALPDDQRVVIVTLPAGSTVSTAIQRSGLVEKMHLPADQLKQGIFGKLVNNPDTYILQSGDRVELYRPLLIDPKEARRQRAETSRKRTRLD
jgi:uncharacterized protein